MADCYTARELEDAIHRLLPPEILADIGIVDVDGVPPNSAAATCGGHHAVVEELAARLAGILGNRKQRAPRRSPPPPYVRELQGRRRGVVDGTRALVVGAGANSGCSHGGMAPVSWDGTGQRLMPVFFEPAAPLYVASCQHPPAMCHGGGGGGGGTGVFLPRADQAYVNRVAAASMSSPIPRNGACMHAGAKPPRMLRKEATAMTMMIARQQQEQQLLQLRAMAAEMEQQRQKREAFAAAFHGGCPALAPRQQWTY